MNKFLSLSLVIFIFLLTLKFEIISNLTILGAFALFLTQIKLKPITLCVTLLISSFLVGYYFLAENQVLLKYALYTLRFLALAYLILFILQLKLELSHALETVFFIHVGAIVLCFIFPPVNDILRAYFSYEGGSQNRFTGFIQGYEFVPFLVTIYLAYDYLNLSKTLNAKFLFKLTLGLLASLLSGRYGIIPVTILLIYILLDSRYYGRKISFVLIGATSFIIIFDDIVQNIYQTSLMLLDLAQYGEDFDFSIYSRHADGAVNIENQYNLSPITLFNELTLPLFNWKNYLFPSAKETMLDPGPSYMMINIGFLLTLSLYIFFFKFIKNVFGISVPLVVIAIFMVIDIKFRTLYVLMPTLWILLNHANHVNQTKRLS